ncbi:hypothetical protein IFM89_005608 [Coptis chinensis]|uniref:CCR4-NOT transcription complex subunit 1 n=1 Tax=Coptis chinensis TaxID=261450 RepID=A0A835IA64_9MAGN|nr:hypothetical protein IFM89_005608 [Coptis chinensis]
MTRLCMCISEGLLIKKQLVTHLTLGIALRYVLDALRKSSDSKMFAFGVKALDQFRDRLAEWPQYCNHILQISHLRGTHSELVGFIEHALARTSSGRLEPNGTSAAVDQHHQASTQANLENIESADSLRLVGSSTNVPGQQFSSPLQMQQRHQGFLEERHKAASTSVSHMKPLLSPAGQPALVSTHDVINSEKQVVPSQKTTSGPTNASSSPGLLRPSRAVTSTGMLRQHSYNTGFGSALNIETLVAAAERRDSPIETPASEVQDKILFMINNISIANIEVKAKEFTEILKEEYHPWFAQYMVMKRASIEPNFHDLYLKFLDKVNSKSLNKEILKATYENCKVLLRSELIKSSSEERSLLKNLGSWLGKFTIGRNQVLRAREIDPKVLIIEAYEKGLMIAVIPFTSKVLEPCQSSAAYQPPNPWTMGILGLLSEIYALPNLKMNLKFDIEYTAPLHLAPGVLVDEEKMAPLSISERLPSGQGLSQQTPSQSSFSVSQLPTLIPYLRANIILNPKLSALGLHMHFQSIVPGAMERAIKEIMTPVVQRSVTIATQTSKELVLKDYAMESDESRIYNAAHLMVSSLAGCLAHVTCKEPLRVSISNHLRNSLQSLSISSDLLESPVQLVTNDNLDLGCALVEQAATEKALQTIDVEIGGQLAVRRKHREGVGASYFDASTYTQGSMGVVPESLRPKPGRLSHSQQRVYEDFVKFPWQNQSSQSSNTVPSGPPTSSGLSVSSGLSRAYGPTSGQLNSGIYSSAQGGSGFSAIAQPLDLISEEMDNSSAQLLRCAFKICTDNPTPTSLWVFWSCRASDAAVRHGSEITAVTSFSATITVPELHSVEPTIAAKDMGATTQLSPSATERLGGSMLEPLLSTGDALEKYQVVSQKLETLIANDGRDAEIQGVIGEVPDIILRCISRDEAALAVAQKVFKSLYENASNTVHVNAHLAILVATRDVCKLVVKELTSWVMYSDEERKFNKDITLGLIRYELLNLAEYNVHMAKLIDAGRNRTGASVSELHNLVDALGKLATRPGSPESLQQLVEIARNPTSIAATLSGFTMGKDEKARLSRDKKAPSGRIMMSRDDYNSSESSSVDATGFREQVSLLFAEWCRICELPANYEASSTQFLSQLQFLGLLKDIDFSEHFFRILTEISVSHCISEVPAPLAMQSPNQQLHLSFIAVDMYAKLVSSLLKHGVLDQALKVQFLSKILSVTVRVIQKDAEDKKVAFNPRPYFRLFINWLLDLGPSDTGLESASLQVLTAFANAFLSLQPLKVPGFSFCDVIPPSCIQMRNVILSAFPRNMRLPDPSTPNLKIDLLAEISQSPSIFSEVDASLKSKQMKTDIDEYLKTRPQGSPFLAEMKQRLLLPHVEATQAGTRYNVPLINSLVLYVGMQAIQQLQTKSSSPLASQMTHTAPMDIFLVGAAMDIFQRLINDLDTEGRYLFLNAVANQLRYPNNHTHYFSFVLLYLFAEAEQESIQEQITRVLLERLIVNRPHPWGLLITFIELIKNPRYNFWARPFTHIAPEIEKLFESVSRSCGGPKSMDESLVSGGMPDNAR